MTVLQSISSVLELHLSGRTDPTLLRKKKNGVRREDEDSPTLVDLPTEFLGDPAPNEIIMNVELGSQALG